MATATIAPTPKPGVDRFIQAFADVIVHLEPGQRVFISGIGWDDYLFLCDVRDRHRRGVRITYDRGSLEIMSPSFRHEKIGFRLAELVSVLADEWGMKIVAAGSTTLRRTGGKQGIEPDECFYIQHTAAILDRDEIDLNRDPPPDLAIEVDITRSVLERIDTYAGLKVPEIWRFNGLGLEIRVLQPGGEYALVERSPTFPSLVPGELARFLIQSERLDDATMRRNFRTVIRQALPPA
jgi:Uma2 family endonuclease